jgi:hypothetical protein
LIEFRVFPNCTAKAKGERQLYVGDGLLEVRELGGLVVRRPHDRVSITDNSVKGAAPRQQCWQLLQ